VACSNGSTDQAGPPTVDADGGFGEAGLVDGSADATTPTDATGPASPDASDAPTSPSGDAGDGGGSDSAPADAALDAPDAASCGEPSGSYTSSCMNCSVSAGMLTCDCQTGMGSTTLTTSLDLCACPNTTTISNAQGVLTCCGNPGGSYTSTCDECAITNTILACTCKTDNGGYISSSIALCTCQPPSKIANTNGMLTCGS
jgi:hypothetical protein